MGLGGLPVLVGGLSVGLVIGLFLGCSWVVRGSCHWVIDGLS